MAGASGPGHVHVAESIFRDILKGTFRATVQEMALLIERTSMSPIIREKQDYAVGLFDTQGRMILAEMLMQGPGMIDCILERYPVETMRPEDVYCFNDPYLSRGAIGHVPDITFCIPVFHDGAVQAFVALFGHFWDVGGISAGGLTPQSTELFHEGILIPPIRLAREGVLVQEVYDLLLRNTRFPRFFEGDVQACISACRLGVRRVHELFDRHGVKRILDGFDHLLDQTRASGRQLLDQLLPDGVFVAEDRVDSDGCGDRPFKVRFTIEKRAGRIVFDLEGTDAQARGPINFILHPGILKVIILGRFLQAHDPSLVLNDGLNAAIDEVRIPAGSVLAPRFPAGVALRALSRILVTNSLLAAFGAAKDGQAPAASCNYGIVTLRAWDRTTDRLVYAFEGFGVGQGARPWGDGIDSVYFIGQKNNPVEWLESEYPFRVERYAIAPDSAGPGKSRGGVGIVRDLRILCESATLCTMMVNAAQPAFGVQGGRPGRLGRILLNPGTATERLLPPLADNIALEAGDVLRIVSAGGGGWGDPLDREPDRVAWDVRKGYVSAAAAAEDYGVILDPVTSAVQLAETRALRERRRVSATPREPVLLKPDSSTTSLGLQGP